MNPKMKKMIVDDRRRRKDGTYMEYAYDEYEYPRNERSGTRIVRRDGTSYPVYPSMDTDVNIEGRFRDRRGRQHYDSGRYAPMRSEYDGVTYDNFRGYPIPPMRPYIPPMYSGMGEWEEDNHHRAVRPLDRIGFAQPEEMRMDGYESKVDMHHLDEMQHRHGDKTHGYAMAMEAEPMTKELAMHWTKNMKNADGTVGPHWTMEQAKQVMEQQKIDCDPIEFYVTLNMMYSDYCKVAKKYNASTVEFYAAMAKAFLEDKDAEPEKLSRYYASIVKK